MRRVWSMGIWVLKTGAWGRGRLKTFSTSSTLNSALLWMKKRFRDVTKCPKPFPECSRNWPISILRSRKSTRSLSNQKVIFEKRVLILKISKYAELILDYLYQSKSCKSFLLIWGCNVRFIFTLQINGPRQVRLRESDWNWSTLRFALWTWMISTNPVRRTTWSVFSTSCAFS